jgi:hypothetical protein
MGSLELTETVSTRFLLGPVIGYITVAEIISLLHTLLSRCQQNKRPQDVEAYLGSGFALFFWFLVGLHILFC